jgi:hypothetical protein
MPSACSIESCSPSSRSASAACISRSRPGDGANAVQLTLVGLPAQFERVTVEGLGVHGAQHGRSTRADVTGTLVGRFGVALFCVMSDRNRFEKFLRFILTQ